MASDPRAWLAEALARLEKLDDVNTADIGLQMSAHYAVDTMLRGDLPAMAAALTAVLDAERNPAADAGQVGDQFDRGYNSGYANAYYEMRQAIEKHLPKEDDRG